MSWTKAGRKREPYKPEEPEYERAVQETSESLAFEEELIQRFRLQDGKKYEGERSDIKIWIMNVKN